MKYIVTIQLDLLQPIDTTELANRMLLAMQSSHMPRGVAEINTIVPEDMLRQYQNATIARVNEIIAGQKPEKKK